MFHLEGKVALITGSSRGIGKAIALLLAENGVHIIVNYVRHRAEAEKTAKLVEARGAKCLVVKANVANDDDVLSMFEKIEKDFIFRHEFVCFINKYPDKRFFSLSAVR